MGKIDTREQAAAEGRTPTLAEAQGMTPELGDAIAALAEAELAAGRAEVARALLEGLVVTNHEDAAAWALLASAHRKLGQPLAAVAERLGTAPQVPPLQLFEQQSAFSSQ